MSEERTCRPFRDECLARAASGFAAIAQNRIEAASLHWLEAVSIAEREALPDPLRAVAHNNAGVARLLRSELNGARVCFVKAEGLWRSTSVQVANADVSLAGRSSAFHLRLAARHQEAFAALRRQRYVRMCVAAVAITKFNTRWTLQGDVEQGWIDPGESHLIASLSDAFGPRCADIAIVREAIENLDGAVSHRIRTAYQAKSAYSIPQPHAGSEGDAFCTDVAAAAQLAALMHPGLLPARPRGRQSFEGTHVDEHD